MTRQSSFKGRVRERMEKTGESYTAARRQLLAKGAERRPQEPEPAPAPAGRRPSDEAVTEATGRAWDEWFALMDEWGARERKHGEMARWLMEEHGVPGWWAQSVTVAYEQARGLRLPGQQPDGTFSANASKTVAVSVERLFEAFADDELRARWLPGDALRIRTARAPRTLRATWESDGSRVIVGFDAKGDAKSQAALAHERLPDPDAAARMKAFWRERLAALKEVLEG